MKQSLQTKKTIAFFERFKDLIEECDHETVLGAIMAKANVTCGRYTSEKKYRLSKIECSTIGDVEPTLSMITFPEFRF